MHDESRLCARRVQALVESARVHAACSQLDRGAVGESELAHSHCILAKL